MHKLEFSEIFAVVGLFFLTADGRTFESIGEDPELAFAMAREHVRGVQSVPGVIANADDFVLNNQETDRGSISAVCDERTRFELYYRGYAGAIEGGVGSFMCSYNRVNGTYSCENPETLNDLKGPAGVNELKLSRNLWPCRSILKVFILRRRTELLRMGFVGLGWHPFNCARSPCRT